jgi:hypothetical protein
LRLTPSHSKQEVISKELKVRKPHILVGHRLLNQDLVPMHLQEKFIDMEHLPNANLVP